MRQALFVSGTIAVVGSVSAYGALESAASLVAALFMAWLSTRKSDGPSMRRLAYSLCVVGASWLLLLGALKLPLLLGGFVLLYALGNPLLISVKASLVLKGLASGTDSAQDNALARELMLMSARLAALVLAAVLAHLSSGLTEALVGVVVLMLALLPLEYAFARRIANLPAAPKPS